MFENVSLGLIETNPRITLTDHQFENVRNNRRLFLTAFYNWIGQSVIRSRFFLSQRKPLFNNEEGVVDDIEIAGYNGRLTSVCKNPIISNRAYNELIKDLTSGGVERVSPHTYEGMVDSHTIVYHVNFAKCFRAGPTISIGLVATPEHKLVFAATETGY